MSVGHAQTPPFLPHFIPNGNPPGLIRLESRRGFREPSHVGRDRLSQRPTGPQSSKPRKVGLFTRSPIPKHEFHPAEYGILRRVVRLVLGRDLQHCRDGLVVGVQEVSYHRGNVLVDKQHGDVFPRRELLEGLFYPMAGRLCGGGMEGEEPGGGRRGE